jgi:hypothetical protein
VGVHLVGGLLGVVEAVAQLLLEPADAGLAQPARGCVDLEVELPELGLEVGIRDLLEGLCVLQGRVAVVVDEVELDLQAGHRVLGVEVRLAQHLGEDVQAAPYLLTVTGAVRPGEFLLVHFLAHDGSLERNWSPAT